MANDYPTLQRLISERALPAQRDAERALLGALLVEPSHVEAARAILDAGDFLVDAHGLVFRAILAVTDRGEPLDPVTLGEELRRRGDYERVGGGAYLAELMASVPRIDRVDHYAQSVKDRSRVRRLLSVSVRLAAECYEGEQSASDLLERAEREVFALGRERSRTGFRAYSDFAFEQIERMEALRDSSGLPGVTTGLQTLDALTGGWQRSDLVLIAARPSVGKTSIALNFVSAAARAGAAVAVFSLEMSGHQLANRILAAEGHVDSHRARFGALDRDEWARVAEAYERTQEYRVWIDDTAGISVGEMRAAARRLKREEGLDVIFADYLQLARASERRESRVQEVSAVSAELKAMAKELDVPVVALSQLSRASETRAEKRPQLSDLRDSGALEQDADLVAFLHREDREDFPEGTRYVELLLEKQRNGPTGMVPLIFWEQHTRFAECAKEWL
jgi:replicative DNA helicase